MLWILHGSGTRFITVNVSACHVQHSNATCTLIVSELQCVQKYLRQLSGCSQQELPAVRTDMYACCIHRSYVHLLLRLMS
jgi:hypothetical protein